MNSRRTLFAPDFSARAVGQIEEGNRLGAADFNEYKRLGLYLRDGAGKLIKRINCDFKPGRGIYPAGMSALQIRACKFQAGFADQNSCGLKSPTTSGCTALTTMWNPERGAAEVPLVFLNRSG